MKLDDFMRDTDDTCDTIVIGDFNKKSISGVDHQYNTKLEQHIKIGQTLTKLSRRTHQTMHKFLICVSPRSEVMTVSYGTFGQITEFCQQHCHFTT